MLFALWNGPIGTWGIADYAIAIVIIAGIVAVATIGLRRLGITIPDWLVQVFWVLVVVFVIVAAIRLLASM